MTSKYKPKVIEEDGISYLISEHGEKVKIPRLQPLGYRVLVKHKKVEEVSEGGIILARKEEDARREELSQVTGIVVLVGEDAWKAFGPEHSGRPWALPGQHVTFARFAGKVLSDPDDDENEYQIMNDDDIVALVPPKREK